MATDVEDSDRILAKKQRTLFSQTNGHNKSNSVNTDDRTAGPSCSNSSLQEDYEKEKRRKLMEWQTWQIRNASEDNFINENFFPTNSGQYAMYQILRELNMENQAVSMAIQNHGLVCPTNTSQVDVFAENLLFDRETLESHASFFRNPLNDHNCGRISLPKQESTTDRDKLFDNDQQQDFLLEQAVSEAIKKKGLSALTVDYG